MPKASKIKIVDLVEEQQSIADEEQPNARVPYPTQSDSRSIAPTATAL